jgi:hypothetical protein
VVESVYNGRALGEFQHWVSPQRYLRRHAYSERRASMTSMRAARIAGQAEATTAANTKTAAEAITGSALGMRTS